MDDSLYTIGPTDEERAAARRFVKTGPDDGRVAVWIESTPDMFCVIDRYNGPRAADNAEVHREGIANVLAEVFAMRRLGK